MGIKPKKLMLRRNSIRTLTAVELGTIRGGGSGLTTEPGRDGSHPRTR